MFKSLSQDTGASDLPAGLLSAEFRPRRRDESGSAPLDAVAAELMRPLG